MPPYPFQSQSIALKALLETLALPFETMAKQITQHAYKMINGIASLQEPNAEKLHYLNHLNQEAIFNIESMCVSPIFCLVSPNILQKISPLLPSESKICFIPCKNPKLTWARATLLLYPDYPAVRSDQQNPILDKPIAVGSHSYIDANSQIGNHCQIGYNTTIINSKIGNYCQIGNNVSLSHCVIGNDTTINSGATLGEAGFGVVFGDDPKIPSTKILQLGQVVIGKHCLIGANSTIDRAVIHETTIGDDTKIDNLVQIGHNVKIGKNCLIAAACAIAGSTVLGNNVIMGGVSAITDNRNIADGVVIGGGSVVYTDQLKKQRIWGVPARPFMQQARLNVLLDRMLKKEKK